MALRMRTNRDSIEVYGVFVAFTDNDHGPLPRIVRVP